MDLTIDNKQKNLKIGFTGSRKLPSFEQYNAINTIQSKLRKMLIIEDSSIIEFHHGDCIGADNLIQKTFYSMKKYYDDRILLVIHPPTNSSKRAFCPGDIIYEKFDYIKRNHNIVDNTNMLIASPDAYERQRSGTWATVRYERQKKRFCYQ